jgi:hypothetical protein
MKDLTMTPSLLLEPGEADSVESRKCLAKTRNGGACQKMALTGKKRCRLHGGLSPGAPKGAKNGNYSSGEYTLEAIAERKRKTASRRRSFRRIELAKNMAELLGMYDPNADQEEMAKKNWQKLLKLKDQLEALADEQLKASQSA